MSTSLPGGDRDAPDTEERLSLDPSAEGTWIGGWLALGIALFLQLAGRRPVELLESDARLVGVLLWVVAAAIFSLTRRPAVIVGYAIAVGGLLRFADFNDVGRSDVLAAVTEWLDTIFAGQNPYDHFYTTTSPPGSPVPYPPIQFLVHLPGYIVGAYDGVRVTEIALGLAVIAVLATLGRRFGWLTALPAIALLALLPNLVNLSIDASNDSSSGAVLLGAVLAAIYADRRGFGAGPVRVAGLAAGLALGMKQTCAFVIVAIACWVWRRAGSRGLRDYGLSVAAVVLVVSLPFLVMAPVAYVREMAAFGAGFHSDLFGWNIWVLAQHLGMAVPDPGTAQVVGLALVGLATIPVLLAPYRRLTTAAISGILLTMVVFLVAPWTSYSYFALLAPLLLSLPMLMVVERTPIAAAPPARDAAAVITAG